MQILWGSPEGYIRRKFFVRWQTQEHHEKKRAVGFSLWASQLWLLATHAGPSSRSSRIAVRIQVGNWSRSG